MLCGLAFPPPDEKRAPLARTVAQVVASLPFWAMIGSLAALLFTGVRGSTEAGFELPAMTARHYFLTQPRVILTYLRLLFWPSGQNVDWDFPVSESFFEPRTALAFLLIAAMVTSSAWLWWWSAKRARDPELRSLARLAAFGPLWFLLVLAPTSSVVPILDVMAEHRGYLPSLGIFLPAAAAGVLLARRFAPGPRGAIAGCAAATAVLIAPGVAL